MKTGDPAAVAYGEKVAAAMIQAVSQALAAAAPAKIGYGTGEAHLNVNRDWFNPADNHWYLYQPYQGTNDQRPSDKTVAVLKVEKPSGELIAMYVNYGLHAVVNNGGGGSEVSGDFPGAMSRYIEGQSGGKAVALWTSGSAGDHHPIFKVWIDRRGGSIPEEQAKTHVLVNTFGQMLAEEALFVAGHIQTTGNVALSAAQKVVKCPGKVTTPRNHPLFCAYPDWPVSTAGLPSCDNYKDAEGPSVEIRLSVLMIDKIALAGVSGELLTDLGLHVKRSSPYTQTVIVALTNGSSGYIPDDANYDKNSYESTTTRIRRGCAETSIINGLNELMSRF
ncbi:MAG: hypothetical protein NTW28_17920 [Candidatus Solibacter sp.]|nr:hypothetical protein [Candidatus Solibacter sp.]